jgi:hypothetical protein
MRATITLKDGKEISMGEQLGTLADVYEGKAIGELEQLVNRIESMTFLTFSIKLLLIGGMIFVTALVAYMQQYNKD